MPIDGRVDISFDPDGAMANMILFAPQNGGLAYWNNNVQLTVIGDTKFVAVWLGLSIL